jgi:Tol biopolymer transport system component
VGDPTTVTEQVAQVGDNHEFDFSVSENGVLAYQSGNPNSEFVWFDKTGKKLETVAEADTYASIALSPDGRRAAVGLSDADGRVSDVWLIDLARGTKSRLTFDPQSDGDPIWSPDGSRIVFSSNRAGDGHTHLYTTSAGATGDDQLLLSSDADDFPTSWSRDGQSILFTRFVPRGHSGVWLLPLSGDHQPKPLLQSSAIDQMLGTLSPDGRFMAYASNESGRPEVYVQTFPPSGNKWRVSSETGFFPQWRDDGKELFYITGDGKLMSAQIKTGAGFESEIPRQLFQTSLTLTPGDPYAVSSDGSRFLIKTPVEANNAASMVVVLNWTSALKR